MDRWTRIMVAGGLAGIVAAHVAVAAEPACDPKAKQANLNFTFTDLEGKAVSLNTYKGKVLLLDFWATWCAPCKIEIPGFIDLYNRYRSRGLQVVGLAVDEPVSTVRPYAAEMKMNYPVLMGEGRQDVQEAFGPMIGLPTTFIIDRQGRICESHTGFAPKRTFEEAIKRLL